MKSKFSMLLSVVLLGVSLYLLALRAPGWYRMFRLQGSQLDSQWPLVSIQGEPISFPFSKKTVVVFWATWCGPCKVELARVARLVEEGKIPKDQVVAVASDEDVNLVRRVADERAYPFTVAMDPGHKLYAHFKVEVTPTLALVDEHQKIEWMTSGLSPTLELRLLRFFETQSE